MFGTLYLPIDDRHFTILFRVLVAHHLCIFCSSVRQLSIPCSLDPDKLSWMKTVLLQLTLLTHTDNIFLQEEWRAGVRLFGPQLKRFEMNCAGFEKYLYLEKDWDSAPPPSNITVRTPPPQFLQSLALNNGIAITAEFLTWLVRAQPRFPRLD
ncbi:hypothetical protein CPB85DRAFT_1254244 [Mucidula mucida]|nr:hypothetical protein CPB85DRAFT_1254244 [Mucidula mucida]